MHDGRSVDQVEIDRTHMRRALDLAARGWGRTAPNPLVGAVVVSPGGDVVGEGYHAWFGGPHAERVALEQAGSSARGGTLYVTLEPCAHFGKTPPCAPAVIDAGIARAVVAVRDPNPAAAGGVDHLRAAGVVVDTGLEADAARELNAAFLHATASDRPWITLKLAVSLDGAIADAGRHRGWLTGPSARAEVHRMRAAQDAIAVGLGTVRADDPDLTVRDAPQPRVAPIRVVFDSAFQTPPTSRLVTTARDVPTMIVGRDATAAGYDLLRDAGVDVLVAPDLPRALRMLRARDIRSLMVEGGARLAGSFLRAAAIDRLVIFQAPVVLGAGALPAFAFAPPADTLSLHRLRVVERRTLDDDVKTTYALQELGSVAT